MTTNFDNDSKKNNAILLTGGAGYIGVHIYLELILHEIQNWDDTHKIVIIDNLSNSDLRNLFKVSKKYNVGNRLQFFQIDLAKDFNDLEEKIFKQFSIKSIIHLAGLKSVKESKEFPIKYYQNNLTGTLNLLELMKKYCQNDQLRFIFSSSATVYGEGTPLPILEKYKGFNNDIGSGPINAYGRTKLWIEEILKDVITENNIWEIVILRYFNPIGVTPLEVIKEQPKQKIPENLIPYVLKVIRKEKGFEELNVFGGNYNTPDGTAIRDYIHVVDLAKAHISALKFNMDTTKEEFTKQRLHIFNIGTGKGYSVLEVIKEFNKLGYTVPYNIVGRRPGDVAATYADSTLANEKLGWKAQLGLSEMIRDVTHDMWNND
tara:strand:- start:67 stop:1191 length:1125 start_codon:yes stop_codon:yes gene_type:complete